MAYWLVKTEASAYSFGDLVREKRTVWSGVKNALAVKHLKAMKKGDQVLVYHTGDEKAVVGMAVVAKADEEKGEVELEAKGALKKPVTLAEIKADARFKEWGLVRIGRLSVVGTSREQFEAIVGGGGRDKGTR